jgi:hypothetical protein
VRNQIRPAAAAIAAALLISGAACANGMSFHTRSLPVILVTERQNKSTVTLHRGQQLRVVLHSTYWQFQKSSHPAVLRLVRPPKVRPRPSGCVPGGGCGTVAADYVATAVGSAIVSAERTSCGEAMGCTAATGDFTVHVNVRR